MSPKAVIAAIALTIGLAIIALLLTGKPAPAPAPAQSANPGSVLNTALISGLSVERPGGAVERVRRSEAGQWTYVAGKVEWPAVLPETAASALAALPGELGRSADAAPAAGGPVLSLALRDGAAYSFRLAPSALGGRFVAAMTSPAGTSNIFLESSVIDPLLNPGPAGWRLTSAAPGARECSRVTLDAGGSAIALAKLDGRWWMRRPINAPASEGGVAQLLGALSDVRIVRFEDASSHDLAAMGLTRPVLSVSVETDVRTADERGEVRVSTVARELHIGGPADPKGDSRFASADGDGSVLFVVPSASVSALPLAPRNLLHPMVASFSPSEVHTIQLTDATAQAGSAGSQRALRRGQGGWTTVNPDGSASATDSQPADELLEFLVSRPGEPEPMRPDDDIRALRKIELFDGEGDPSELLVAGYTADGLLAIRSGNLLVTYSAAAAPALLQLPAFNSLPPEGPAPATPTLPPDAPTGK